MLESFRLNSSLRCLDCAGEWIQSEKYLDHLEEHHSINGVTDNKGYVLYSMDLSPTALSGKPILTLLEIEKLRFLFVCILEEQIRFEW